MNIDELKIELDRLEISELLYSLDGVEFPSAYILKKVSDTRWEISYCNEFLQGYFVQAFDSEEKACKYLVRMMKEIKEEEESEL